MALFRLRTAKSITNADRDLLEERRRSLAEATEKWQTVLRDMELQGESGQPRYETYFQAYLQAREQEKRADLELFNLRAGLIG